MIFFILLCDLIFSISAFAQKENKIQEIPFNSELADNLGADQFGMKTYVATILQTGPNDTKIINKIKRGKLFKGHFSNIKRLSKLGKLVFAGPIMDAKPNRGLFIFNVKTIKEAEKLLKMDPTVMSGIFAYKMMKLYGSAALMQINNIHKTIKKKNF